MATTTSITTTYSGEKAAGYIDAAILSGPTIANEGITVKPNVKYKQVLKRVSTTDLVADGTCDFTPTDTITLDEKILTPKELQVNLQLCKQDFRSDWDAAQMGYSAWDELPKDFADFILMHVAEKVAGKTETDIWQGDGANAGEFTGFETLLALDAELPADQEVAGIAITAANVITEMGKVVDAIPQRVYSQEDLYLYVAPNVFRAYVRALGGFASNGLGANGVNNEGTMWYGNDSLTFDGIKVFRADGMSSNVMIAAQKSNLYFGTGLLSDHNEVKLLDMADLDGSQNVRVIMRYTAGVQYGFAGDIVTYNIINAAN